MTFAEAVIDEEASLPVLPMFHTTALSAFREIGRRGSLGTESCCPIDPHRRVAYLFYGLPVYVVRIGLKVRGALIPADWRLLECDYMPVAMILRPEAIQSPVDLYPFDTGAMRRGLYGPRLSPGSDIRFLRSEGQVSELAPKLVTHLFGTNTRYIDGQPRAANEHPIGSASRIVAEVFEQCRGADDRRMTVEIVSAGDVSLKDNLRAMIVPKSLRTDPEILELSSTLGAEIIPYHARFMEAERMVQSCVEAAMNYLARPL